MNDSWIPVLSALSGGTLVGVFNLAKDWMIKRSEERRHTRELVLKTAFEHWKQGSIIFMERLKAGKSASLQPLDAYIVHAIKVSELLLDPKASKEEILAKLREVDAIAAEVEDFYCKRD